MNAEKMATDMIASASKTIGAEWKTIQEVAVHEFQMLASRVARIVEAVATGEMKKTTAGTLFKTAKSQIVAVLALLSTMLAAAAQKVVNAALAVIKSAVNAAAGFALVS